MLLGDYVIEYKILKETDISESFLDGYKRFYRTRKMCYLFEDELLVKDIDFIDDWDTVKLKSISLYLKGCIKRGGVVVGAFDEGRTVGFANLEPKIYLEEYIVMPYIHVTSDYRGKGIGRILFSMLEEEARKLGGKKLYISTHPDVSAQRFYDSVGTVLATRFIKEIYDDEPADIQREKCL